MRSFSALLIVSILVAGCNDKTAPSSKGSNSSNEVKVESESDSRSNNPASSTAKAFTISSKRVAQLEADLSNLDYFALNANRHMVEVEAVGGKFTGGTVTCNKQTALTFDISRSAMFSSYGMKAQLELSLNETDKDEVEYDCTIKNAEHVEVKTFKHFLRKTYVVSGTKSFFKSRYQKN